MFLTYRTNAMLARAEVPGLQVVDLPSALSVGALYGVTRVADAPAGAGTLIDTILGDVGRNSLSAHGFDLP